MMKTDLLRKSVIAMAACAMLAQAGTPMQMDAGGGKPRRQFYSLQSKVTDVGKVVELQIYDEIGFWGITAKQFVDQLHAEAADAVEVVVAVNSPGGDVFDAFAIYNALRRYEGKVTARVDGYAASAASLIIMAGDKIVMPENAMIMIHNPSSWPYRPLTAAEMRKTADMMDKAREGIVAAYRNKSGQEEAELIRLMDEETWLTALEAQALGFCDMIEEPVKIEASVNAGRLLARFSKTPEQIKALLAEATGDPAPAPAPVPKPTPVPDPAPEPDPAPVDAAALAAHVFTACRAQGIGHLAEPVLLTSGLSAQAAVDERISAAKEIASLCLAAKLPDQAVSFVAAGFNVEQVRARLFDEVTKQAAGEINNRQRPEPSVQPQAGGPNASSIYAKRQAAISNQSRTRTNQGV